MGWRSGTKSYQNQPESVSSFKRILKSISNLFILSQHRPIRGGAWWVLEKIYSIVISKRGTFSEVRDLLGCKCEEELETPTRVKGFMV